MHVRNRSGSGLGDGIDSSSTGDDDDYLQVNAACKAVGKGELVWCCFPPRYMATFTVHPRLVQANTVWQDQSPIDYLWMYGGCANGHGSPTR